MLRRKRHDDCEISNLNTLFASMSHPEVFRCACGRINMPDGKWAYPETAEEQKRAHIACVYEGYCPHCVKQMMHVA